MDREELEWLTARVEAAVDDLKAVRSENKQLSEDNKKLHAKVSDLERRIRKSQKEGAQAGDLIAQNKAYKKKYALLKTKVSSMLAKVEVLQ